VAQAVARRCRDAAAQDHVQETYEVSSAQAPPGPTRRDLPLPGSLLGLAPSGTLRCHS
jgi:hypothetical protein